MNPRRLSETRSAAITIRQYDGIIDLSRLAARHPDRYPHLLESAARHASQGRYDILFAFPGERIVTHEPGEQFLDRLAQAWQAESIPSAAETALPFHGGWFLFLSYELTAEIEPSVHGFNRLAGWPLALAERFPSALIVDHQTAQLFSVCENARAAELLPRMEADLQSALAVEADSAIAMESVEEDEPGQFTNGVARILDYIRAGDVFQVNLSRAWRAQLRDRVDPVALYQKLRAANPSPFGGLLRIDPARAVVSSSPERLVEVRGRRITTRPIAGTFPRGLSDQEDQRLSRELTANAKERAEHVMLVDLERNDIGRVARPGTVKVSEMMTVESYRHVHHIVSAVEGELRDDVTPDRVIAALFPGGTITGCPKVRTLQIINELESAPRGAYTGSMGYLNRDGSLDLNILIRSFMVEGRDISWRAGAGIVADSDPQRELMETSHKARGLLRALGLGGAQ